MKIRENKMWLEENRLLVVTNIDLESEEIHYRGVDELKARRRYHLWELLGK